MQTIQNQDNVPFSGNTEAAQKRLAAVKNEMDCLYHGDDFLFTNLNGNRPRYEALESECKELQRFLGQPVGYTPSLSL